LAKATGANDCQNYAIYNKELWDLERLLLLESSGSERSYKKLLGVSQEVRGIPIVQYSEQNRIIFNHPKTEFISVMTYFAKQGHL